MNGAPDMTVLNENGSGANPPYEGPFTLEWSPAQS